MYILTFFVFVASTNLFAQTGTITGKVTDAKTEEPLIGVNIIVNELENVGAAADLNGKFSIKVPVGSYSLRASLIGYTPMVKTDVIVKTGGEAKAYIKLSQTSVRLDEVTVTADYFDKAIIENDLSTIVLGAEEVRRSPGSSQDFQRILQGMAGVSFSTDQTNELLVRGGSPNENLTVLDNMEIHSTNHYPNQFNSGGPINMINVDLIQDIQFSTGGFISKYGDKLSSVLVVTTREGTRSSMLKTNANLSMAGFGAILEGGINGGKGSWIFSARKSYIDLIAGSFGLTAIPKYYDLQFKAAYDLSNTHKLSLSGIYGNDRIFIEGDPEITNTALANSADSVGVEKVDVRQYQYAAGISLKSIWSNNFYSIINISKNNYNSIIDVSSAFTRRNYNSLGKVYNTNILNDRTVFKDNVDNGEMGLRTEFVWNANKYNEVNFGGALKFGDFKETLSLDPDTTRYDINKDGIYDANIVVPGNQLNYNFKLFEHYKNYSYINDKIKLFDESLILNIGLRYDYFSYSKKGNVSPRLSASYYVIPGITSINFAYGEYYQTQNYPTYGDRYQSDVNRYLENTHARHFVFGYEQILSDGLKLNVETYYKKYTDIPVREEFIHFDDKTFRSEKYLNVGKQKTYGVDLMLQQKLVKDIYGTLSYSHMWSKFDDPRIGREGKEYSSDYEFPDVLTLIIGKRFSNLRNQLDEMPFFIKYPAYILPFSNDMEISVRWRFASGRVYTPRYFTTFEQHREGGLTWSKGAWQAGEEINSSRYSDYHRLDIAFNSRYNFSTWNLSIFLSIQNIYNRKNIAGYQYNSDGTYDTIYQFAILPVAGFEIGF